MRTRLRLILAVVAGVVIGDVVNMALIAVSGHVIAPPPGGIGAVAMIPAPLWFSVLDLLLAYLPAAWLGHWLVAR